MDNSINGTFTLNWTWNGIELFENWDIWFAWKWGIHNLASSVWKTEQVVALIRIFWDYFWKIDCTQIGWHMVDWNNHKAALFQSEFF